MNKTEEDDQRMSENDEPGRTVLKEERKALSLRESDKRIKEESILRKELKRMEWERDLARVEKSREHRKHARGTLRDFPGTLKP